MIPGPLMSLAPRTAYPASYRPWSDRSGTHDPADVKPTIARLIEDEGRSFTYGTRQAKGRLARGL